MLNDKFETYRCDEVREKRDEWISDFRRMNRTDEILACGRTDRMYDNYCKSIDDFLDQCKCEETKEKILLVCSKCTKEEHEGYFCRCEDRNIRLARQIREEGKSPWNEMRKIREEGKSTC